MDCVARVYQQSDAAPEPPDAEPGLLDAAPGPEPVPAPTPTTDAGH
jgi:hypothetical protein